MTKLTPLEELSEKLEIYSESHYDSINDTDYTEYTLTTFQLEQLRKAIIKDFVSKAEVKAALIDDPLHLNGITKDDAAIKFYSLRGKATKLYALPEWSK